jgi:hypothetical protein
MSVQSQEKVFAAARASELTASARSDRARYLSGADGPFNDGRPRGSSAAADSVAADPLRWLIPDSAARTRDEQQSPKCDCGTANERPVA